MGGKLSKLQESLLSTFFEESFEGIEKLESGLLALESTPDDISQIHDIFRAAHSLKGAAGTFGFQEICDVAHEMETLLDQLRAGQRTPTFDLLALLLHAVDVVKQLLNARQKRQDTEIPTDDIKNKLRAFSDSNSDSPVVQNGNPGPEPTSARPQSFEIRFAPHPHLLRTGNDPLRLIRELGRGRRQSVTVDLSNLPPLAEMEPEDSYLVWRITTESPIEKDAIDDVFAWVEDDCDLEILTRSADSPQPPESPQSVGSGEASSISKIASTADTSLATIRVPVEKIDGLMNMVGELVITQSMLGELDQDAPLDPSRVAFIREGLSQLARNTRSIQESVMRLRSMPIGLLFNRFPRLVFDLSRQLGKKIQLDIRGETTELDKTVLERLGDPLVHLVRNSLDHGIETPEERRKQGKPETGVLTLNAHHRGGDIVVEVIDDGRG